MKFLIFLFLILFFNAYCCSEEAMAETGCRLSGECRESIFLRQSFTLDENGCLNFCKKISDCSWFTFHPEQHECLAFANCGRLDNTTCQDCITGESTCSGYDDKCWIKAACQGTLISTSVRNSAEECLEDCFTTPECQWFTFNSFTSSCILLQECTKVDTSCFSCISSSTKCKAKTGYSKLLVGLGQTASGLSADVEIVDLDMSSTSCKKFQEYPLRLEGAIGGLSFDETLRICGGFGSGSYVKDCYSYSSNTGWNKATFWLIEPRAFSAMIQSPFVKEHQSLFVAGGYNGGDDQTGPKKKAEVLTHDDGWQLVPQTLPEATRLHCMVLLNSTTALVIGGIQGSTTYSNKTYFFNTENEVWVEGPVLNFGRYRHSCAKIRTDSISFGFSVVVAGGFNGTFMTSVEILDQGSDEWRAGPELPFGIYDAAMFEDSTGGGILVGGHSDEEQYLDTLFQIPNADEDSDWIELPQKLKTGRFLHSAYLVPSATTSCTLQ